MKKNAFIILISIIFLLVNHTFTQVSQQWVAIYNGATNQADGGSSIAIDDSGNVYVAGYTSISSAKSLYLTVKYNSSGTQQWVSTYSGTGTGLDIANSIAVDPLHNVYVTGRITNSSSGTDCVTIKYNSEGVQQWVSFYNGASNSNDHGNMLAVDASGNVYVTGSSTEIGTHISYLTIKYNTSGVQQWVAHYNGYNYDDVAYAIAIDNSGYVYVTGASTVPSHGLNIVTIKYNNSGVQQWAASFDGPVNDVDAGYAIAVSNSGNVYVTGESVGSTAGYYYDYITIKYNSSGVQLWAARYDGPGNYNDVASSIAIDGSENVYITGGSRGTTTYYDYATIKYNSSGTQMWVSRYNYQGNGDESAHGIALDAQGNVYVTGTSAAGSNYDYATIKYNPSGEQQWVARWDDSTNNHDVALAIAVDAIGNVYVTGVAGYDYTQNCVTIKYSQLVSVKHSSDLIPDKFALHQNYPNPFNPSTKIKFDIPLSRGVPAGQPARLQAGGVSVKLTIYDLLGHEVATLVNEQLQPGTYEVQWDGSNYPSGVYFYKLTTGSFSLTKKMVLVK